MDQDERKDETTTEPATPAEHPPTTTAQGDGDQGSATGAKDDAPADETVGSAI